MAVDLITFFADPTFFFPYPPFSGGPSGRQSSLVPGMRPLCPPLQSRQLARVDERAPREHHQEGPVPGPVPHRGQQAEPEAAVERRQALLPVGRRELFLFFCKIRALE